MPSGCKGSYLLNSTIDFLASQCTEEEIGGYLSLASGSVDLGLKEALHK